MRRLVATVAGLTALAVAIPAEGAGRRCLGERVTLAGTAGDDVLRGTPRADVILASAGDDVVRGAGGRDRICGGSGDDRIDGGAGGDRLEGGPGDDRLQGGKGRDRVSGGAGRDRCLRAERRVRCENAGFSPGLPDPLGTLGRPVVTEPGGTAKPQPDPTPQPSPTPSPAPTQSATPEPTATATATASPTATAVPTVVPTVEPTATPTATPTIVPTVTPVPTPTATPVPVVTTTLQETHRTLMSSGGAGLFGFTARHEFNGPFEPFTRLPGLRIPRGDSHAGTFGQAAYGALWLAPAGKLQFSPEISTYEATWFSNYTEAAPDGVPLGAGDRFDIAMVSHPSDNAMSWSRPRGDDDGSLAWDTSYDTRRVTGRYQGVDRTAEVIFFRADIVARGGDVDARGGPVRTPPLTIPLPKRYGADASSSYIVSANFPATHYTSGGFEMRVQPQAGVAVLSTSVTGYLQEAREVRTPGGADLKEWHVPLHGMIILSEGNTPQVPNPRGAMGLPTGGVALVGNDEEEREVAVPAGGAVITGPEVPLEEATRGPTAAEADTGASGATMLEELTAAAEVSAARLTGPLEVATGVGAYSMRLDPDWRGTGTLGITDVRRGLTGTPYLDAFAVPYVRMGDKVVELRADKLVELRVLPFDELTVGFTGWGISAGGPPYTITRAAFGSALFPGFNVIGVYDLGGGAFAFVEMQSYPDDVGEGSIHSSAYVLRPDGRRQDAVPIAYEQVPGGELEVNGAQAPAGEFSMPLDQDESAQSSHELRVGRRVLSGTASVGSADGIATVVRADTPIANPRLPDAETLLAGGPVGVYYAAPDDQPRGRVFLRTTLMTDDEGAAQPKPLGTACGTPQVTDGVDSLPPTDVREAWFDSDTRNLYATMKVANLPAAAPAGTKLGYAFTWRTEHVGRHAVAWLDDAGQWSYFTGWFNAPQFTMDPSNATEGEVRTGADGLVRLTVPRASLEGNVLRDTSARTLAYRTVSGIGVVEQIDGGPDGSEGIYGFGGEYRVGGGC